MEDQLKFEVAVPSLNEVFELEEGSRPEMRSR
jgi:hypothetical protein